MPLSDELLADSATETDSTAVLPQLIKPRGSSVRHSVIHLFEDKMFRSRSFMGHKRSHSNTERPPMPESDGIVRTSTITVQSEHARPARPADVTHKAPATSAPGMKTVRSSGAVSTRSTKSSNSARSPSRPRAPISPPMPAYSTFDRSTHAAASPPQPPSIRPLQPRSHSQIYSAGSSDVKRPSMPRAASSYTSSARTNSSGTNSSGTNSSGSLSSATDSMLRSASFRTSSSTTTLASMNDADGLAIASKYGFRGAARTQSNAIAPRTFTPAMSSPLNSRPVSPTRHQLADIPLAPGEASPTTLSRPVSAVRSRPSSGSLVRRKSVNSIGADKRLHLFTNLIALVSSEAMESLNIDEIVELDDEGSQVIDLNSKQVSQFDFDDDADRSEEEAALPVVAGVTLFGKLGKKLHTKRNTVPSGPNQKALPSAISLPLPTPRSRNLVFGRALKNLPPSAFCVSVIAGERIELPVIVFSTIEETFSRGLHLPIFRLAGNAANIDRLAETFSEAPNYGSQRDYTTESVVDLVGVLKRWMTSLSSPVFHPHLLPLLITEVVQGETDIETRTAIARISIQLLPPRNFGLFVYLMAFLAQVVVRSEQNRMSPDVVAAKLASALFGTSMDGDADSLTTVPASHLALMFIMEHWVRISENIMTPTKDEKLVRSASQRGTTAESKRKSAATIASSRYSSHSSRGTASTGATSISEPTKRRLEARKSSSAIDPLMHARLLQDAGSSDGFSNDEEHTPKLKSGSFRSSLPSLIHSGMSDSAESNASGQYSPRSPPADQSAWQSDSYDSILDHIHLSYHYDASEQSDSDGSLFSVRRPPKRTAGSTPLAKAATLNNREISALLKRLEIAEHAEAERRAELERLRHSVALAAKDREIERLRAAAAYI
ncbi:uncharacterized protein L969DRAFT_17398 [Mixia osmundae IAM 14324]|uniref:Rho-GAP domain-containing protein n=1 Tax=Mixia osmundae (strain CBS 9802 / IAM 14324 / JCM 22182 / KY 12970) TaxID=764103 RepID=G7E0T5_MIXOS|nr:uncharacterized protein L969DRAFT_17398 [Mixia osmundae IAM 14324]KEI39475.1 hypothetical protein L969DRAFT_17398 [Mixia osmundae IAM 14324]GAA96445.1 hypothetical protein E5Q_03112 [Mixia osmundae IAM 14324]